MYARTRFLVLALLLTFDSAYGFFGGGFGFENNKTVSTLDANGHAIEDAFRVRDGSNHGNWIKQKTFALKDKGPVPTYITYRTITYYQ